MPTFLENFSFDAAAYVRKISTPKSLEDIALNIYRKRRAIMSARTKIAGGAVMASVTGGLSSISSAVALRHEDVESEKLNLLENEWGRRGQHPLPQRHFLDKVIPVIISTAVGILGFHLDFGGVVDGMIQKAFFWLADALHVTGQTISSIPGFYNNFTSDFALRMGQSLGTKAIDSYDSYRGIPNGYYHSPHPQYPHLYMWNTSVAPNPWYHNQPAPMAPQWNQPCCY